MRKLSKKEIVEIVSLPTEHKINYKDVFKEDVPTETNNLPKPLIFLKRLSDVFDDKAIEGVKIREIVEEYLISKGVNPKIPPTPLL